ncbi:MAG: hypothetical protein GY822_04310 [Deltaproteobacteria bacterium]|nr:hypothetical protein [Deltaproteobacteria bacterium]
MPKTVFIDLDLYGSVAPSFGGDIDFAFASRDQFPLQVVAAVKGFVGPVALIFGAGTGIVPDTARLMYGSSQASAIIRSPRKSKSRRKSP